MYRFVLLAAAILSLPSAALPDDLSSAVVTLHHTNLVIPTYLAAPPSAVPRFYEGRTYQGAKALFYPYPVQDVLTETKVDKSYRAVYLENRDLEICVLPELGGRIFSARDKNNGYDFFYRQHVIKPALIGMLGAWISGGVEWNVPHHHRATSFMTVDSITTTNADGSATIWVGETELRHRLQWSVGITLHPGRSDIELACRVSNPTPFAHPMLFWINPAVHCDTNYQVIFPPSTEWVVQHAKPEFASWPIARQRYGGTDYSRGVDISWWKNHPTPVSFFAWNYEDDWFGGYDHGRQAGVVHWADHHVAPGKKFFEWGNGPEGETWSRILSDEDGPYLELMAGAWSDNQPDYSWIQPGETRQWHHWWYPVRDLGGMKAANRELALNLEITNGTARVAVNATRDFSQAALRLSAAGADLLSRRADLSPVQPFGVSIPFSGDPCSLRLTVADQGGRELISYQPQQPRNTPMPKTVERPRAPREYTSIDELYYTGQRIEQLYSPSFEAQPYYQEILKRDSGDYRAHTALGILLCKQWRWPEAVDHLQQAIARATANHIRPRDLEAFYYLGVAFKAQGQLPEAAEALQKASWSSAWHGAAGYLLAEIEASRGSYPQALRHADAALEFGQNNSAARNLKSLILRRLGRPAEAAQLSAETLRQDPLNPRAWSERILAQRQQNDPQWRDNVAQLRQIMGSNPEAYLENAIIFANAGQWLEVATIMADQVFGPASGQTSAVAMEAYLLAFALDQLGRQTESREALKQAGEMGPAFSFPSRFEEERILRWAIQQAPEDATAPYLLGCLLYDNRPADALQAWEESRNRNDRLAFTHRNLALAYAQLKRDIPSAISSLETAVALNPAEPRFLYELDLQYEAGGTPLAKRLDTLSRHHNALTARDDAFSREIQLLTASGNPAQSLEYLKSRRFRNWEGSSQIHSVYVDACLARGRQFASQKQFAQALESYRAALEYPENLEVGRARRSPRAAQIEYLIGTAYEGLGDAAKARSAFENAVARKEGSSSENQFYYALALQKLDRQDEAKPLFEKLIETGREHLKTGETADYFAKFGEKQSERVRQANAHFLSALGQLGLGRLAEARRALETTLELHPAHLGALTQLAALPST